jgi:hypothetical protein
MIVGRKKNTLSLWTGDSGCYHPLPSRRVVNTAGAVDLALRVCGPQLRDSAGLRLMAGAMRRHRLRL